MVLLTVLVGMCLALGTYVLLHGRVNEQLFSDRVPGELPCKLVAEASYVVDIIRVVDDLIVARLEGAMVLSDSLTDSRHGCNAGAD